MHKISNNKSYPIRHYIKIILTISFMALLLDLIVSIASISIVKQQSTQYLQDTADLYINRINHDFAYINQYMGWTMANDESLKLMSTVPLNSAEFITANRKLRKLFSEMQKNYEQEYNFFVYLQDCGFFINSAPMNITYVDYQELKRQIISYVEDKNVYERFYSKWTPILVNGKYYIINIVPHHERYLISMISADNLIKPLHRTNLGASGKAALIDSQGNLITSLVDADEKKQNKDTPSAFSNLVQYRTTVDSEFSNATFTAKMVIGFGAFEKIMVAQLLIFLLAIIMAFTLCIVILYFMKRILKPLQLFSRNLTYILEDSRSLDFKSNKIIELEQANNQFKQLTEQIKAFKIDIYERELEKQRIQLAYMKLQINPHFFLNCLTSIYSMAQVHMYKEIESMTLSTSKYFRYIFQAGENFVPLEDELEHIAVYLDIQKSRYRDAFSYHIKQAEDTKRLMIPPLLLQIFIENSMKYAVSREHKLIITLEVSSQKQAENEMIVIRISDTGPGFPPDVLDKLCKQEPLKQTNGSRIGIMNVLQRLQLLYHLQARVEFFNDIDGGATIILTLPKSSEAKNS